MYPPLGPQPPGWVRFGGARLRFSLPPRARFAPRGGVSAPAGRGTVGRAHTVRLRGGRAPDSGRWPLTVFPCCAPGPRRRSAGSGVTAGAGPLPWEAPRAPRLAPGGWGPAAAGIGEAPGWRAPWLRGRRAHRRPVLAGASYVLGGGSGRGAPSSPSPPRPTASSPVLPLSRRGRGGFKRHQLRGPRPPRPTHRLGLPKETLAVSSSRQLGLDAHRRPHSRPLRPTTVLQPCAITRLARA